jgi:hypothetical protein
MPWKRAKALPSPSNELFDACFRIQREAIEAAGHHIPLVVENVCGAQKWVGRARWHYGSFYLWGDVPALMPIVTNRVRGSKFLEKPGEPHRGGSWFDKTKFDGPEGERNRALLAAGDTTKVAGLNWSNYGKPGYKAEAFNSTAEQRLKATSGHGQNPDGRKVAKDGQGGYGGGFGWDDSPLRRGNSKSSARKAASAHIAKIPEALARHIGQAWHP